MVAVKFGRKTLIQLIKPIVGDIFSDTAMVQAIFSRTDARLLRPVIGPVLDRIAVIAAA